MKWIVPFALTVMIQGCAPEAPVPGAFESQGEVEVTVNGEPISRDMMEAIIGHMPQARQDALLNTPEQKKRFLDSLISSNLLYKEAIQNNAHNDPKVQRALAMASREILANLYLSQIGDKAVTDEAIQAKYDENKVKYGRPSTKLHHFLVRKKPKADEAMAELQGGADFATVARKYDPRANANGGDMGWVGRAPLPELAPALTSAPLNEPFGPIESAMGQHIIKIEARRDKTPIDEVRDELAQMVKVEAMKAHQADVKEKATITYAGTEAPSKAGEDTPSDAAPNPHAGHDHGPGGEH